MNEFFFFSAVKYILEEGALAFQYTNEHSCVITPLCWVSELTNAIAIKIALLLLNSIADIKLIICETSNESGSNYDIDSLLCTALRKDNIEIICLLHAMNFDIEAFKKRIYLKCKNKEYKYFSKFDEFSKIHKLKDLCRLKIRSHLGTLDKVKLYKPINCFEATECNLTSAPQVFLKRLNSLQLSPPIINYLNFNLF